MKSTNLELVLSLPFLDRKKYVLVPPSNQENNEKVLLGFSTYVLWVSDLFSQENGFSAICVNIFGFVSVPGLFMYTFLFLLKHKSIS